MKIDLSAAFSLAWQNQITRPQVAFGAAGFMVICAVAAFFAGGHRAAGIIAAQAGMALCFAYAAAKRSKNRPTE